MYEKSKFFFCILFIIAIIQIRAKKYYEAVPKETVCKILDPKIVYNFTCTSKYINQTMSLRSQEITFQSGVVLHNYHFEEYTPYFLMKIGRLNLAKDPVIPQICEKGTDSSMSLLKKMLNVKGRLRFGNWYTPCPVSGRRYENDVPMDNSKMPDVAITGEHRFDVVCYTFINGTRKEFSVSQHFGEIRTKPKNGLK